MTANPKVLSTWQRNYGQYVGIDVELQYVMVFQYFDSIENICRQLHLTHFKPQLVEFTFDWLQMCCSKSATHADTACTWHP